LVKTFIIIYHLFVKSKDEKSQLQLLLLFFRVRTITPGSFLRFFATGKTHEHCKKCIFPESGVKYNLISLMVAFVSLSGTSIDLNIFMDALCFFLCQREQAKTGTKRKFDFW
jgi:hypothetical protein